MRTAETPASRLGGTHADAAPLVTPSATVQIWHLPLGHTLVRYVPVSLRIIQQGIPRRQWLAGEGNDREVFAETVHEVTSSSTGLSIACVHRESRAGRGRNDLNRHAPTAAAPAAHGRLCAGVAMQGCVMRLTTRCGEWRARPATGGGDQQMFGAE
jgi:hypothetical protein